MNDGVIDKVVQSQPVWVLKLELVVVGEQTEEVEGRQHLGMAFTILNVLEEVGIPLVTKSKGRLTFISEGNRSRCVK